MPGSNTDGDTGREKREIESHAFRPVSQTTDLAEGVHNLLYSRLVEAPSPINPNPLAEHRDDSTVQVPVHAVSWSSAAGSTSPSLSSLQLRQERTSISTSTVKEANGVVTTHTFFAAEGALTRAKEKQPEIRAALARVGCTEEFQVQAGFDDVAMKHDTYVEEVYIYLDMKFVFENGALAFLHNAFQAIFAPYQGTFYFGKMSDGPGRVFSASGGPERTTEANGKAKWKGEGEDVEAVKRGRHGRTLADNRGDESGGSPTEVVTIPTRYPAGTLHIPGGMMGKPDSSTMPIQFSGGSINLPGTVIGNAKLRLPVLAESGCWRRQLMREEDNGISAAMAEITL